MTSTRCVNMILIFTFFLIAFSIESTVFLQKFIGAYAFFCVDTFIFFYI